jgi:uncharacterized protein
MKCPKCPDAVLVMSERQTVEIDYCPLCRGVWLDRGELDKLIERSALAELPRAAASPPAAPSSNSQRQRDHDDFSDSDYRSGRRQYGNRKKSWLGEIFD